MLKPSLFKMCLLPKIGFFYQDSYNALKLYREIFGEFIPANVNINII